MIKTMQTKHYTLVYFTGYGIREISSHTIDTYPINVRATSVDEALEKLLKKARNAHKYNKCFEEEGRVPIIEKDGKEEKIGVLWLEDKSIVWEGEKIYWGFQVYNYIVLNSFILPTTKYKYFDNNWIKNHCCDTKFASYKQAFLRAWDRFNSDSLFGDKEKDLDKYFFKQIKSHLKKGIIPKDEIDEMKELLKEKEICQKK